MNKTITVITILIFLILGGTFWYIGSHRTIPSANPTNTTSPTQTECSALTIISPQQGNKVTSPLSLSVIVDNTQNCQSWTVFEAQAGTVELTDSSGIVIGRGILKTTDDWALPKPVPYNATIPFAKTPAKGNLTLTITEENPSGKPNPQVVSLTLSQ